MSREVHVRFCERAGVRFPRATRPNMGLKRMAEACRGVSFWQLARVADWHVREETYLRATARLVDA